MGKLLAVDFENLLEFGSLHFLVLVRYDETCHADYMKLILTNGYFRKVLVEDENAQVQCLWRQMEATMHIHKPLYKVGSRVRLQLFLNILNIGR